MSDGTRPDCVICRGGRGDKELKRVAVWEDDLWRLTTSLQSEVLGFSYLEPRRHIPHVTDLDGEEAKTLGATLARTTRVLKEVTGGDLVYVYVFGGGVPHLHLHLAPHRSGDALNDLMVRGAVEVQGLPSGVKRIVSKEFPPLPERELRAVAVRIRRRLSRDAARMARQSL